MRMNRYQLIRGFDTHGAAQDYADRLPASAGAKVVPYSTGRHTFAFCVDVLRTYVGGRL